jgi:hypothetical protein
MIIWKRVSGVIDSQSPTIIVKFIGELQSHRRELAVVSGTPGKDDNDFFTGKLQ